MKLPEKRLLTNDDMQIWQNCQTKSDLLKFLCELADAVKGLENSQYSQPISGSIQSVEALIECVDQCIKNHPVESTGPSRFGKGEFRDLYDEISRRSSVLIKEKFGSLTDEQVSQLSVYFNESWGNKSRIDYGSGHELNFLCFLYGLYRYGVFDLAKDNRNLVLVVFMKYLETMRVIETMYWLEPAGSHGVWGLDDYHFLPFLFGASQLSTHRHLKPKSIHNPEVVEMFSEKYLYFGCIDFINSVKTTASLRWHSPMLDDISGVKEWAKVYQGMVKMYDAEVLCKLPIMQHFYFSEFLPCPEGVSPARKHSHIKEDTCCGHGELRNTWGDCCGIKIPSAIAATQMQKNNHKPIPFD